MKKSDYIKHPEGDAAVTPDAPDSVDVNDAQDTSDDNSSYEDNQIQQDTYDHAKESGEKWSEQRGVMTWVSLVSMILLMAALFFVHDIAILTKLGDIAVWYFATMGSIVIAFFGVKAVLNFRK
ncbi:MAG: hypothetical protein P4L79_10340 [Legionella sp.]|uniref:hypothetical protein n=1 Tax=Legionella sp. TaxID=459 RepID=UPI002843E8C7|nr:hypothetical protein [Legionella sp.]